MQSGRTLLHFAAQLGHCEAVECLLEKKADADAEDKVNNIINIVGLRIQVYSTYANLAFKCSNVR